MKEDIKWQNPKEFNLIPPQVLKSEGRKRVLVSLAVSCAIILAMLVGVFSLFPSPSSVVEKETGPVFPELALSQSQLELMKGRTFFSQTLSQLAAAAQGKIWLSALQFQGESKTITLFGQGYSADQITAFVNDFQESAKLKQGKILSLSQDEDLIRVKWEGTLE